MCYDTDCSALRIYAPQSKVLYIYGLLRAARSRNPPVHSDSMGPLPHYILMSRRVIKSVIRSHASMARIQTFYT